MLTKAGKQALYTMTNWTATNDTQNRKPMFPEDSIRNTNNNERWVCYVSGNLISSLNCVNNLSPGFYIGSGTTPTSDNDYCLESQITSGYSMTLIQSLRGVDINQNPYMEFWFIVENTSTNIITLGEIGFASNTVWCSSTSTGTAPGANTVLIDRTVFNSSITLNSQESCRITYRITSNISFT